MTVSFSKSLPKAGDRLPDVALATCDGINVKVERSGVLFSRGRSVVVGVVGAFTPVCTNNQVSEFVQRAGELAKKGFSRIFCVAPNDPWTVAAWAKVVDPRQRLFFLSDGNLEFGRALGVCRAQDPSLFVGERNARYLALIEDGRIERLSVDPNPFDLTCTGVGALAP